MGEKQRKTFDEGDRRTIQWRWFSYGLISGITLTLVGVLWFMHRMGI